MRQNKFNSQTLMFKTVVAVAIVIIIIIRNWPVGNAVVVKKQKLYRMQRYNLEEVKGRCSPFSSDRITRMQCYDGMRKCRISLKIFFNYILVMYIKLKKN